MNRIAIFAAVLSLCAAPVCAEPIENGTEIAQLLEILGDRCWAIDLDGQVFDAAALSEVDGPIDIELECVLIDPTAKPAKPLPSTII